MLLLLWTCSSKILLLPLRDELEELELELLMRAAHPMTKRRKVLKKIVGDGSEMRVTRCREIELSK